MFKTIIALSVAVMTLTGVSAVRADELPAPSVCHIAAEAAYDDAVEAGNGLPDGAYEQTMNDCETAEDEPVSSLNEMIAIDGEVWFPVCQFSGGCVSI